MNHELFKNKLVRKTLSSWCAFATLVTIAGPAWAAVTVGDYLGGAANLNGASSAVENYGAQTDTHAGFTAGGATGVLDWNRLNIPGGATMEFNNGTFYNVVNSAGGMSTIAGAISGTDAANVYIFNPNGILFHAGSSVDVGGIFGALATGVSGATLSDWMLNPTVVPVAIQNGGMTGDITVNGGTIKAAQIAFAGLNVSTAEEAKFENKTVLAAGDQVAIDGFGGGTITLTIPDAATEGDVDMLGQFADNLEAMAAGNVRAANGTLTVSGGLTVNTYGDVDVQPGAFVVNNATVSAKSIAVTARGDVSVVGQTDLQTTAGDLKLVSQTGQTFVLGTAGGEAATIQANGGDLTVKAVEGILVGEGGALVATKKADDSKGDVTLTSTGRDVLSDDGIQIAGSGAKVSADNGVTLTAEDGDITIKDGAEISVLAGNKTLAMTAAKGAIIEDATSRVSSQGETILKAAADKDITLTSAENDFVGTVGADGANLSLKSKDNLRLGTVTARGTFEAEAVNGAVYATDGAQVLADGNLTLNAKTDVLVDNATVEGKNIVIDVKTDGEGSVVFENGASVYAKETLAVGGANKPDSITVGDVTVSADKNVRLAAAGDAKIDSAVTAGKNLTVIGKNVNQNADFTAKDGSVYVEATAGDIVMKAGTQTMAKRTTTPNPHTGEGNVLYTAAGDVRAEAGGATISADPDNNEGSALLTSTTGGSVGENITVNAAHSGGAVVEGDIRMHVVGDSEVALVSKSGSIALTHENGTLTISKGGIGGADQVVRVDAVDSTTMIPLSGSTPSGLSGLSAKQNVTIEGRSGSSLVVKADSGIFAEQGAVTVDVDQTITVDGSVTAGSDAQLVAGGDMRVSGTVQAERNARTTAAGNLSTPGAGKLVAGRDLVLAVGSSTPQINIAVGKGVSARSGQRAIAFRTVGGYAYPEVYGNNSKTAVCIDGRVAGGNSADLSILQGYEQVVALGNIQLTLPFSYLANFNPLGTFVDAQAPGAEFGQANLTSDKGELIEK